MAPDIDRVTSSGQRMVFGMELEVVACVADMQLVNAVRISAANALDFELPLEIPLFAAEMLQATGLDFRVCP